MSGLRIPYLQRDGYGETAERAIEQFVVLESGGSNTDDPYFKEFAAQGQNLFDAAGDHGSGAHRSGQGMTRIWCRWAERTWKQKARAAVEFGDRMVRRWRRHFTEQDSDSIMAGGDGRGVLEVFASVS